MSIALLISIRSTDKRLQVGCVLVSPKNRIIATGYNGHLEGVPHISHMSHDGHEQATVHAEQNAITDAARRGVSLDGATAYITHYPCSRCTLLLVAAGIKKIFYHSNYKNDEMIKEMVLVPVIDIKPL